MKKIVITLLCAIGLSPLWAQDSTLVLSLNEAQDYAVRQNRSMQNAGLEVKKAYAQRWQTIAAMLPQADASGQYINMCNYEMNFLGGQKINMPNYVTANVTASIGLNGQAIVGVLLNNIAIEMQDITRQQTETDLRGNVMTTYMSVKIMESVTSLLDSTLANMFTLAEQTRRMVEVGAAEQTQYDQMLVRVNAMKNNVNQNKRNVDLAYNTLRVLLGVSAETELVLTSDPNPESMSNQILDLLAEPFVKENNYNYQLLQKNVELAKKNKAMAGWAYGPTLGATYQYQKRWDLSEGGFNMTPPNMVAVSLSLPLWSSGKRAAGVTEKKIALMEAQNTFEETSANLEIQHRQLCNNLENAYAIFVNEQENLDVTNRVMKNVMNKYTWGSASLLELTNAGNDVISAQSTYVQASLTLIQNFVELEKFLHNGK